MARSHFGRVYTVLPLACLSQSLSRLSCCSIVEENISLWEDVSGPEMLNFVIIVVILRDYFSLGGCTDSEMIAFAGIVVILREYFSWEGVQANISLWEDVSILAGNISLWEGVTVLQ